MSAIGCLRSFKDESMNLAGCSQKTKQGMSREVDLMLSFVTLLCSGNFQSEPDYSFKF